MLVGDFLYSRAFQLMVELESMAIQKVLADTTNRIAEGEVLQLLHVRNPDTDEAAYLRVIERKTAVLFAAATQLGGHLAGLDAAGEQALHDYGMALGYAFQIADDVLDYAGDAATLGKNLGDDLAEGKATLPLIHAMAHSTPEVQARLKQIVIDGDAGGFPRCWPRSTSAAASTTAVPSRRAMRTRRSPRWARCRIPRPRPRSPAWPITPCSAPTEARRRPAADHSVAKRSSKKPRIIAIERR